MIMIPSWIGFPVFCVMSFVVLFIDFYAQTNRTRKDILPTLRKTAKWFIFAFFIASGVVYWTNALIWFILRLWR